jgi:hypothetical protein
MADWQAASPNAALFEGGESVLGVIIAILIIVLLVYLIIELSHNHSMSSPLDGAAAAAPPPALFR